MLIRCSFKVLIRCSCKVLVRCNCKVLIRFYWCLCLGPWSVIERGKHGCIEAGANADVDGVGEMSNDPTAAGAVAARSQVPASRAGERPDSRSTDAVPRASLPDYEGCSQAHGRLSAWQGLQRSV